MDGFAELPEEDVPKVRLETDRQILFLHINKDACEDGGLFPGASTNQGDILTPEHRQTRLVASRDLKRSPVWRRVADGSRPQGTNDEHFLNHFTGRSRNLKI